MLACSVDPAHRVDQVSQVAAIGIYIRLSVLVQDYALGQWRFRVISGWFGGACGGGVLLVEHGTHVFILTTDLLRWN
jgi:hypothetical protein